MTEPSFNAEAPLEAFRAVVLAIERASTGDPDGCCVILADSDVDDRWLVIVANDTLAGLCRGPHASLWWDKLRAEAHDRAIETGAPDAQLRCTLHAIAIAEARERAADLRLYELQAAPEFTDAEIACVMCQLAGMVAAHQFGDRLPAMHEQMRRHYGIGGVA